MATQSQDERPSQTAGTVSAPRSVQRQASASTSGRVRRQLHATLPGCWGALLLACLSFTPSLLPRGGLLQGIVCGISAAIGYGLGVLAASIWRAFADRGPRPPRPAAWLVFVISAVVLFGISFALGQYWQSQIRSLMGVTEYSVPLAIAAPLTAAIVFCLLILLGRGLRGLYRWTANHLNRWIGRRAATALGWILVVAVTVLVVNGVLLDGLVSAADQAFSVRDTTTEEGAQQPTSSLRSGGPDSLVPWDMLGRQGRQFTGTGPTASDIANIVPGRTMEPIRAYAGLATSDDTETRAIKAVDDLERAGGFQRANLLVVSTTGSGWVDPAMIDTFEYLSGGDSAAVAIQYSYLPSWISYLVDQSKAREAGRALFDVVYDRWSRLPQNRRPRLYVAGEAWAPLGARPPSAVSTT